MLKSPSDTWPLSSTPCTSYSSPFSAFYTWLPTGHPKFSVNPSWNLCNGEDHRKQNSWTNYIWVRIPRVRTPTWFPLIYTNGVIAPIPGQLSWVKGDNGCKLAWQSTWQSICKEHIVDTFTTIITNTIRLIYQMQESFHNTHNRWLSRLC